MGINWFVGGEELWKFELNATYLECGRKESLLFQLRRGPLLLFVCVSYYLPALSQGLLWGRFCCCHVFENLCNVSEMKNCIMRAKEAGLSFAIGHVSMLMMIIDWIEWVGGAGLVSCILYSILSKSNSRKSIKEQL